MNSVKRLFAGIAGAFMLLTTAAPMTAGAVNSLAGAETELTDGTFTYEIVNGSYTITKCEATAIVSEIPEMRNGYAITAIADGAFMNCAYIPEITIPDTVKSIGRSAFAYCTSMKSVHLPDKLGGIADGTFMGCTMLESVDIPDSVSIIDDYAFFGCQVLSEIKLPASLTSIGDMAFAECMGLTNIDASNSSEFTVSDGILYNKDMTDIYRASTALSGDVVISNTVERILPGAFSLCESIEHVFLPSSVMSIGDDAFSYCSSMKKIDMAEGLNSIGNIAFKFCYALESADFPTTLKSIGDGAFYQCKALARVTIPDGITSVGEGVFVDCPALNGVLLPESLTDIGANAFGYKISDDGEYTLQEGFTLDVHSNTPGLSYAKSNGIAYNVVNRSIKSLAFIVVAAALLISAAVFAIKLMAKGKKSAPAAVKKADKEQKELEEAESYQKILDDSDNA